MSKARSEKERAHLQGPVLEGVEGADGLLLLVGVGDGEETGSDERHGCGWVVFLNEKLKVFRGA